LSRRLRLLRWGRLFYHKCTSIYICKNRVSSTVKICTKSTHKR
jgi:hypothetical protein